MANCRHKECNAPIFFATTWKNRQMPLDAEPNPEGKWVAERGDDGVWYVYPYNDEDFDESSSTRYTSHFETCPFAHQFTGKGKHTSPSQQRRAK